MVRRWRHLLIRFTCRYNRWLSDQTWDIVELIAPCRREMFQVRCALQPIHLRRALRIWQVCCWRRGARTYGAVRAGSGRAAAGWTLIGDALDCFSECHTLRMACALWQAYSFRLQRCVATSLVADRAVFLDGQAHRDEQAIVPSDFQIGYAVARAWCIQRLQLRGGLS